jgi:hypothetical protein
MGKKENNGGKKGIAPEHALAAGAKMGGSLRMCRFRGEEVEVLDKECCSANNLAFEQAIHPPRCQCSH